MTQKEFTKAVAADANEKLAPEGKKVTEGVVDTVIKSGVKIMTDSLAKGDKIQINGFGTFEVRRREAREGRNPSTGETINIAASNVAKFKAGKALKDALNA